MKFRKRTTFRQLRSNVAARLILQSAELMFRRIEVQLLHDRLARIHALLPALVETGDLRIVDEIREIINMAED